jgi:TPR repeat protein
MKCRSIALSCLAVMTLAVMSKAESQMPKTLAPSSPQNSTARKATQPALPNPNSEAAKVFAEFMAKVAANDPAALETYGAYLLTGCNQYVQRDEALGISYLEKAAGRGRKTACVSLALHYEARAKRSLHASPSDPQRETGNESDLIAESIKWALLSGTSEKVILTRPGVSDLTKSEGLRRAGAWAKAYTQAIPVTPK